MIIFKKLRWKNFLSYGNYWSEVDLLNNKSTLISGKNGGGKCLEKSTEINIKFKDKEIEKKFKDFLENS